MPASGSGDRREVSSIDESFEGDVDWVVSWSLLVWPWRLRYDAGCSVISAMRSLTDRTDPAMSVL
jgi:hypothetical protein